GLPTLQPMINNAAVRLSCAFHTPANIGLYSSAGRPNPPARISARLSSPTTPPGGAVNLTLTVQNSLPNPISGVIVTALFPPGLSVEEAGASKGSVEVLNARMVTVLPGEVAANAAETITLTLRAAADVPPGAQLQTVATLFYAESAADQTPLTLAVGPAAPADRSVPAPQVGSPLDPAQAPPPDVLPITGGGECRYVLWLLAGVLVLLGRGYQSLRRSGY
ncbi:MAG: hypothetical protein ACE5G8_08705, partial [Anaerolineae bacterium]